MRNSTTQCPRYLPNYESLSLDFSNMPGSAQDLVKNCRFDSDPTLMKNPYRPQGTDTWVTQRHVSLLGNADAFVFANNTLRHAMLGVDLLTSVPPVFTITEGQFADIYLAGVVSIDNSSYSGAQLTVVGSRFTFPTGASLPATSQVAQTQAQYKQALNPKETVGIAALLVPTTVRSGCRFEQLETNSYTSFNYESFRPRQLGITSQRLGLVIDNTFLGLSVGIAHGLRNGTTDTEVRGNAFVACAKAYAFVPFDAYAHPQPTGTAFLTCSTFARGVAPAARTGISYGIYQESGANVTVANPAALSPSEEILKNLFDDGGAGTVGYYALYNANSSQQLAYTTYDNYWNSTVAPLVNAPAVVSQLVRLNYPNNNTDCHLTSPTTGLQRAGETATADTHFIQEQQAALEQNVPNPARGTTRIRYTVPTNARQATLLVRRALDGQLMATHPLSPAANQCNLSLRELPAGLYFYTLVIDGNATVTRRLMVE